MYRGVNLRVGVLIVALLAGSGAAFAAPLPQGEPQHQRVAVLSPLAQAWHWMTSLFDTALAAIQGDPVVAGGGSGDTAKSSAIDVGMGMDPNGGW